MPYLHVIDHPLVQNALGYLRNKDTQLSEFRFHSNTICRLLFSEALQGLHLESVPITTPLTSTTAERLQQDIAVFPVLRAGLAMLSSALEMVPSARVGFIGLQRDEKTAIAHEYYWKAPKLSAQSLVFITDPMLATGGSTLHILRKLKETSAQQFRVVCVVASPEGLAQVQAEFPEIEIFTAAVDDHLNDKKYIVPGLGDYGDRYFGTE